jgi:hypothetical protein
MGDPLIDAHWLWPNLFVLGSPLTPISIRDQMVRSRWLVDRLISTRQIRIGDTVLVVGAGVAGATAAIRAAQLSVNVLLVEQSGGAFGVQARSNSRWVDPVQYDWPARHWAAQFYPVEPPWMPLGFNAGFSNNVAAYWDTILHGQIIAQHPRLCYQPNIPVTALGTGSRKPVLAQLQTPFGLVGQEFDLVVWAVGFGQERTTIPRTGGGSPVSRAPFWSTDTLTDPNCGIAGSSACRVLILGCGDGALQDFLRAATALSSAREIYHRLPFPAQYGDEAQDIEAQFHRALIWSDNPDDEACLYKARDDKYRALVADLWADTNFRASAIGILRKDIQSIEVAFQTPYLTPFYGLNCLLARILAEAWAARVGMQVDQILRAGWRTREGDFNAARSEFEVTVEAQSGCPLASPGTADTRKCEVLIIRIGIDPRFARVPLTVPGAVPVMFRTRHLFPYHMPG